MNRRTLTLASTLMTMALISPLAARAQTSDDDRASYSFVRSLEGDASVAPAGRGVAEALEVNQPLVTGDLVRVDARARAEIVLADRTRLVLGGDSQAVLERVAFSADRDDRATRLRFLHGEMLLAIDDNALGDDLPTVATDVATLYIQQPGTYSLRGDRDWLEVTVRDGYAEVVSDRGSSIVRRDETLLVDAGRGGGVRLSQAGPASALERWNDDLYARGRDASLRYVDPEYRYVAAPLNDYGSWVDYEGGWCWRPRVELGWRPYWNGRWAATPSGLTWVSHEPWGWYPYHYGTWVFASSYGWVWRPGRSYSPAWVYWYWGDNYAGWCPVGYYTDYYRGWYPSFGLRVGLYGWIGGRVDFYNHWNFVPVDCFRDHNWRGRMRTGHDLGRELGRNGDWPRGVLTTDTRDLPFDRLGRPGEVPRLLRERASRITGQRVAELPDVTDFVGRKSELPTTVRAAILIDRETRQPRLDPVLPPDDRGRDGGAAREPGWKTRRGEVERQPAEVRAGQRLDRRPQVEFQNPRPGVTSEPRTVDRTTGDRKLDAGTTNGPTTTQAPRRGTVEPQPGVGERRALPGANDAPRVDPGTTAPRADDRQGWRRNQPTALPGQGARREAPADTTRAPRVDATPPERPTAVERSPRSDDDPPVRRVVDGVRSSRPGNEAPPSGRVDDRPGRPEAGSRYEPGNDRGQAPARNSSPPSASAPRAQPPQSSPPPTASPRMQSPPRSTPPPSSNASSKPAPRADSKPARQHDNDRPAHHESPPPPAKARSAGSRS